MPDVSWTIDGITADGIEGATPTITRGGTITLDVLFSPSLSGDGVPAHERYKALREFSEVDAETAVSVGQSDTATPWYRETLPNWSPVDSLLVDVAPGVDVIDAQGVWAVVVGCEDNSAPPSPLRRLSFELFVLAPLEEYDTKTDVRDAFEAEVI